MTNMISSFLNPGKAYKKAGREMDKYYQQGQQAIQPYMQHGNEAYGNLSGAMQKLMDPSALYNDWMGGYEASPYAQDLAEMANNEGLEAASSMGLSGSTPVAQALQAGRTKIMNADRNNYFDKMLNNYISGAGIAQNIYGQGANSASQYGQNAMNQGQQMGQMAYGQQAAPGQLFNNLLQTGLSVAFPAYGMAKMAGGAMGGSGGGNSGGWNTNGSYNPMGGGNRVGGY
jgi:hypothetical protein